MVRERSSVRMTDWACWALRARMRPAAALLTIGFEYVNPKDAFSPAGLSVVK
jgi:hypothetical protein